MGPVIRKMLDISTGHLPRWLRDIESTTNLNTHPGIVCWEWEHGWLMWVPDDPDESAEAYDPDDTPAEALVILRYARSLGCDFVLIDRDTWLIDDLPTYDD